MPGSASGFIETSREAGHLSAMIRLTYRLSVLIVVLGIGGAMSLRGQTPGSINAANGVAIQGYDVVAYVTQQQAVKGDRAFRHEWRGVTWQFASAEHRDRFARSPDAYAPEFGGFCAYGVSRGYAVDIDPQAFTIDDGKLYLNYSKRVQSTWNQDRAGYIEKARQNWPKVSADLEKKK
jgi:YHS domain-containing protein